MLMNLCLINHSFKYELEKLVRIFLPFEKIIFFDSFEPDELCAVTELFEKSGEYTAKAELFFNGVIYKSGYKIETQAKSLEKEQELKLALALFDCFTKASGYYPEWGVLTGVRPAKLFSRLSHKDGMEKTEEYFRNSLRVSDKKLNLCKSCIKGEDAITSLSKPDSVSLYISVPFCPTRCSYCSFVSHSVEQAKKLIPQYTELLCREIEMTAEKVRRNKLRLETIYIGGGTPTSLSAEQIKTVMDTVRANFDLSNLREYTVEAGRPDTITKAKLEAILSGGATRISINPQTMNDSVLEAIGRKHTARQTVDAFIMAREVGFDNINMDLIAGLPTDTFESFKNTLNEVLMLSPESVTVHSLSMKRSSRLTMDGAFPEIEAGKTASMMVDYANQTLNNNGIFPYYMYRQSKTVGNLENVGYSKKGFECLYNVYIMDETHSILACGASGVTKLREPKGDYIERIFNFKYPYEYIERFDEILQRKDGIDEFYSKFFT